MSLMLGTVYCLHFLAPVSVGHPTQHYVGFAEDLDRRIAAHRAGKGARLTQVALERGIEFEVVWAVPGTRDFERRIKNRKMTPRYCPICAAFHGWRCQQVAPAMNQLMLPFTPIEEDLADFPDTPARSMDWYEVTTLKRWRASSAPPALVLPADWDDGLL